jgi:hypothetical protein
MTDAIQISAVDTAKLVRKALKAAFPDCKFWVRTDPGLTWFPSLSVYWVDGPNDAEVKAVIGRYEGATFDSITDSWETVYDTDENGNRVQYRIRYASLNRHYSPEAMAEIVATVRQKWNMEQDIEIKVDTAHFAKGVQIATLGAYTGHVIPGDLSSPEVRDEIHQIRHQRSWVNRSPGEEPLPDLVELEPAPPAPFAAPPSTRRTRRRLKASRFVKRARPVSRILRPAAWPASSASRTAPPRSMSRPPRPISRQAQWQR